MESKNAFSVVHFKKVQVKNSCFLQKMTPSCTKQADSGLSLLKKIQILEIVFSQNKIYFLVHFVTEIEVYDPCKETINGRLK